MKAKHSIPIRSFKPPAPDSRTERIQSKEHILQKTMVIYNQYFKFYVNGFDFIINSNSY